MQRAALSSKMVEEPRDRERKNKVSTHTSIVHKHSYPTIHVWKIPSTHMHIHTPVIYPTQMNPHTRYCIV